MCGIFGWVLPAARRQSAQTLARLTDLMAHRGPDGSGYWLSDTADERHQIGFGHRRLAIIDIAGGVQPMWSADKRFALIFNGEVYNYIELREELIARGCAFRTNSDTEVLLEAYRTWGESALSRLRGMFAFALWDTKTQSMLLARDAFGKKPLFLAERAGALVFGSEMEPLLQFPEFDRELDSDALGHYLLNRYVPGPATFFRRVKKLPPGCFAVWRAGRLRSERYFTPPFAATAPDIESLEEAVRLFGAAFDEAVRIRMRSDAPFGAYLSGGVDSSAVVAMMSRHSSGPVRTFSVGFRDPSHSELEPAREVAERFATEHEELVVEPDAFFETWPLAIQRRGAPVSEASDIPILMLSRMASRSVKMVLTGEGADELMGGYPKHRAEPWISLYQRLVPSWAHDWVTAAAARALPYGARRVKIALAAAGERGLSDRMRIWFGGLSPSERDRLLGRAAGSPPPDEFPFSAAIGSSMRRTLFFDQTSWLPDNLLERGDRMMMAGSIEGRMPFMDVELAALVARFPDRFLIGSKGGKRVLRLAMNKVLPAGILRRKKIGFRVPFEAWFRGPFSDVLRDLLTSDASQVRALCSQDVIRALVREHIEGRSNNERILWSLVNLEMFFRTFKPSLAEAPQPTAVG